MGQASIAKCTEVLSDQPAHRIQSSEAPHQVRNPEPKKEPAANAIRKNSSEVSASKSKEASQSTAPSKQKAAIIPSAQTVFADRDREAAKVEQLRKELQLREQAIDALRKDAAQRSRLVQALENEAFEKAEAIEDLRKKQVAEEEAKTQVGVNDLEAVKRELEEKEELIVRLQQRVAGDEETLKSVIAEARAKGDAVEGLVCSLTRQVQMGEEARQKIRYLEDQRRDHDDAIAMLKAAVPASDSSEAVEKLRTQLSEKELKIKALQAEVAAERAVLSSSFSASTAASSSPSPAKAAEPSEVRLKQTRRMSQEVVAGVVSQAIMQVAMVKFSDEPMSATETTPEAMKQDSILM